MTYKNLVLETATSTGTGDFTLVSSTGWRDFATAHGTGSGNTFAYAIRHQTAAEYEVGTGYMSDSTTLVRQTVTDSSNSNALVSFSAGTKDVIHAVNAATITTMLADIAAAALKANNLSDLTNAATARTNLGLGTLATQNGTFSGTHSGTSSGTNTGDQTLGGLGGQPLDATLTALAGALTAANKIPYATATDTLGELTLDTDGTLAGNSDTKLASQKAVKTYVDLHALCLAPFEQPGVLAVAVGKGRYRFPIAVTLISVAATVNTAPTGASVLVDVNKNGTTIFTTQSNRPSIAASAFASSDATPDVTAMAAGDYLTVDIDQIGSTIPGADLEVLIRYKVA